MKDQSKIEILRDDKWLLFRLNDLWEKHFADIPQQNKVFISFGRFAKYRLGSIRLNRQNKASIITITSMFKSLKVPQEVVDHTIGHELVHYTHGFSSTHPKLHKYPHAGGVVKREMIERGMEHLYEAYKKWIKEYRQALRKMHGW